MHEFFGRPAAAYILIYEGNKVLMLRRVGPWKPGQFVPPSGHVEAKETLLQAAQRELKEEVGVDVKLEDLVLTYVNHRAAHPDETDEREYLDFYFKANAYRGEIINAEPDKHTEVAWISLDELNEQPVVDYCRDALLAIKNGQIYGESGW